MQHGRHSRRIVNWASLYPLAVQAPVVVEVAEHANVRFVPHRQGELLPGPAGAVDHDVAFRAAAGARSEIDQQETQGKPRDADETDEGHRLQHGHCTRQAVDPQCQDERAHHHDHQDRRPDQVEHCLPAGEAQHHPVEAEMARDDRPAQCAERKDHQERRQREIDEAEPQRERDPGGKQAEAGVHNGDPAALRCRIELGEAGQPDRQECRRAIHEASAPVGSGLRFQETICSRLFPRPDPALYGAAPLAKFDRREQHLLKKHVSLGTCGYRERPRWPMVAALQQITF